MNAKRLSVYVLILIVLLMGWVFVVGIPISVNTKQVYMLSNNELKRLENRVEQQKDGDAAYRIALYYERSLHDEPATMLWIRKAATLGNPTARHRLDSYEKMEKNN